MAKKVMNEKEGTVEKSTKAGRRRKRLKEDMRTEEQIIADKLKLASYCPKKKPGQSWSYSGSRD